MSRAIALIQERVALAFAVPVSIMRLGGRQKHWVLPRHVALYLSAELVRGASQPFIARQFNKLDHSCVRFARERVEARIAADPVLKAQIESLRVELRPAIATLLDEEAALLRRHAGGARRAANELARQIARGLRDEAIRDPDSFLRRYAPR